ncbi:hypothetical protein P153DRAFT_298231 [Dothidotthia symphoricarpi CBS 119687]|uniref:Mitotic checkpoint regulator, MAD2B-interacting-domain-containing protein n=1 Tax=Dothidotthia symphoricarpi CBS 119687 TaxID=1392245 RepID=A0A6A6A4S2_9PLEO|nr:uncharacterized protein P153DRAFT_298231 [Dothidotthia symphoricarpi CBS 119687]KAF2126163.1 hypothetical protein P153DRAFT_298231 [Dothidotthia symphoricarpi CBS 119687]
MNLLAYSDSESDTDAPIVSKPAAKTAPKPAFQKVVDRANPGRIKVNLPGAPLPQSEKDDIDVDAPPAKKARLGGGSAFGGFSAMLPAPKKPNATAGASSGKKGVGKGPGAGVNLRTGAEPAFKREPRIEMDDYDEDGNPIKKEPMKKEDFRAMLNLPTPKTEKPDPETAIESPKVDAPKAAAPRFVPMSVGKGKKKKPVAPRPAGTAEEATRKSALTSQPSAVEVKPVRKPKVSLFGVSQEAETPAKEQPVGAYKPMLYGFDEEDDASDADEPLETQPAHQSTQHAANTPAPHDLTHVASELNLSEAERRQLFGKQGRGGPDFSSAKIVDFNTDTEYAHNEKLRQQGETVQHNPLKSISGTGKNNLRSLINVATTQKDALEDHFASSHRNKKEAGNRYGW